jgi:hypothetical protein
VPEPCSITCARERTCRRGLASLNGTTHSHAASIVMDTGMGSDDPTYASTQIHTDTSM